TFKFTPRSQKEAKMVREIIRLFKMHMYPEYKYNKNSSAFYLHPSTFDFQIHTALSERSQNGQRDHSSVQDAYVS
ncbi:hypothetical protein CQA65_30520, partial [Klebsiella pneumoniae]